MKMLVVALCLCLLLPEVSFAADSYQMTATSTVKILTDLKSNKTETGKSGSVYQVDGVKDIDGKKYYHCTQDDVNGYIPVQKMTRLDHQDASFEVQIIKPGYNLWTDFYWSNNKGTAPIKRYYEVKHTYKIGNGKTYYSVYDDHSDGHSHWAGYINANAAKKVTDDFWTLNTAINYIKEAYDNKDNVFSDVWDASKITDWQVVSNRYNTIELSCAKGEVKLSNDGINTWMTFYGNQKPLKEFIIRNNSMNIIGYDRLS